MFKDTTPRWITGTRGLTYNHAPHATCTSSSIVNLFSYPVLQSLSWQTQCMENKCPIIPLPRARETCPKSASLIDLRHCVNMPDARGRHDTACQTEWQPIEDIAQEWYRDFGCDYDDEVKMYLPTASQRRMLLNRIESFCSFCSVLYTNASLFSERYRKVELRRLVPEDVVEQRPEESWLETNYRQRLHDFDTDCAGDDSQDSLRC